MTDLSTSYLGLRLRSPLVASASPLTGTLDGLRRLEAAGAAAVVLPSLFEEQLVHDSLEVDRILHASTDVGPEAAGYFPELDDYNTGPDRYLLLVEQAKQSVAIPVIASINGVTSSTLARYAHLAQSAGADAVELNLYTVVSDPDATASDVENRYLDLVRTVKAAIDVPLAVKLGPAFTALAHMCRELVAVGADGLVLFNRFYQPDIDLEELDVVPRLALSTPDEVRLTLRWIGLLRGRVDASLAATSGIHSAEEVVKALLAGADVAMLASVLLARGVDHLAGIEVALRRWMEAREYASVSEMKGLLAQRAVSDPADYERAGYLRTIASYRS